MTETKQAPAPTGKEGGPPGREGNTPGSPDTAKAKGFAKARELAGKLKGMLHRDNGEGKNPEAILNNLKDLRESKDALSIKKRTSEAWKKATSRNAGRLFRRGLSDEAIAWQKNNKDVVDAQYNQLKGDKKDLSPRERFKLRAQAINITMDEPSKTNGGNKDTENNEKTDNKLTRRSIKNSEAYKTEVNQRLDIMTSEKGRPLGKLEIIRVKRDIINETLDKDRNAAKLAAKTEEDSRIAQRQKETNELVERNRLRRHKEYPQAYADAIKDLNPDGKPLSKDDLAKLKVEAHERADVKIKQIEASAQQEAAAQKKAEETKVIDNGDYHAMLAKMLLDPVFTDDPDIQKKAMEVAIAEMKAKEARAQKNDGGAEAGGPASSGAETSSTTETATAEASAATQSTDIMKLLGIDTSTEEGQTKQRAIEAAIKALTATGKDGEAGSIDTKGPLWKQVLAVIAALVGAGVIGAVNIAGATTEAARTATS